MGANDQFSNDMLQWNITFIRLVQDWEMDLPHSIPFVFF